MEDTRQGHVPLIVGMVMVVFQEYDNILINLICIMIAPYHFGPSNREFQSDDLTGFGSATHFDS